MATWNIGKTLGKPGGFGQVYEVTSSDNKKGALKKLLNPSTVNKQRFEREIKILQNLRHQNIITIYEWNLEGHPPVVIGPFYIMEYMAGGDLRAKMNDILKVQGKLFAQKWALQIVILPIIEALQLAHSNGTFHRDLKPENLLFTTTSHDHIKVADWGLGKDINKESLALTAAAGGLGGTHGYAAPEQWFDLPVDGRADIFSLGIIFYEMMTGKLPPSYDNFYNRIPVPLPSQYHPSISSQLNNVILKMIALRPENRYQSIQQVKTDMLSVYRLI